MKYKERLTDILNQQPLNNIYIDYNTTISKCIFELKKNIISNNEIYLYKPKSPTELDTFNIEHELFNYTYERNISHQILESKYNKNMIGKNESVYSETTFFRSGISSILCLFLTIKRILNGHMEIYGSSSYFETDMIHNVLIDKVDDFDLNKFSNKPANVLFFETVKYDKTLKCNDVYEILQSLRDKIIKEEILFVIMDTTLYKNNDSFNKIITLISELENVFLIEVISLMKTNQYGMELTNCGAITIYSNKKNRDVVISFSKYLKKLRNISGTGLSIYEISVISNEIFFDSELIGKYRNMIYKNARKFYTSLEKGAIFNKIIYPDINEKSEAPFIVLYNNNTTTRLKTNKKLLSIIYHEIKKRNINIHMGSSFGFNTTRYELIIVNHKKEECFLKIAIGAFDSDEQIKLIKLINHINSHNLATLLNKYSEIKEIEFDEDYD